jgi:hypothetical protein
LGRYFVHISIYESFGKIKKNSIYFILNY